MRKLGRRFQRDATHGSGAEIVDHNLGRLLQIDPLAALQGTALAANGFEKFLVVQGPNGVELVARCQQVCVVGLEVIEQFECHFLFVEGVAANGAAGGQVVAALGHNDARPQHAGRVVKIKVVRQRNALFELGNAGFIAGLGGTFAGQGVDERGLAHVGDAADQHTHGLDHATPVRRQLKTGLDQRLGRCGHAGIQRQRTRSRQRVVMRQPVRCARGISQILLVEHLERGLASGEFGQHRVGAGARQAGVEQLDHHIDVLDALADRLLRQMHMTGKPLDSHLALNS